jgi:ribonuclease BN (tRNA processing enzyme)
MKIITLGTSPGKPTLGKSFSAILIESQKGNFLFDCGEGTAWRLQEQSDDMNSIDAVIISHFHPDHVTGIYMVLQMLYLGKRTKPLTIYLPEQVERFEQTLHLFYLFKEKFHFNLHFRLMENLDKDYPFITPIQNSHLIDYKTRIEELKESICLKSYSFTFTQDNKKIHYTSDIKEIKHLDDSDKDLIIIDALHPDGNKIYNLIKHNTKKYILTHGISQKLQQLIQKSDLKVEIADDKKIYSV